MVECQHSGGTTTVERVQIIDLENAAYLPKGRCIKGMLAGNDNWRSPEAHFKGELNKPTDIFSFGVVVSSLDLIERILLNGLVSASTLCLGVSSSVLTRISENIKPRVHCLLLFASSVKFHILETQKELMVF
jgi:serine/threonine protein kinase